MVTVGELIIVGHITVGSPCHEQGQAARSDVVGCDRSTQSHHGVKPHQTQAL